jgi:hypothetical protein
MSCQGAVMSANELSRSLPSQISHPTRAGRWRYQQEQKDISVCLFLAHNKKDGVEFLEIDVPAVYLH